MAAARHGNIDMVKFLLKTGADALIVELVRYTGSTMKSRVHFGSRVMFGLVTFSTHAQIGEKTAVRYASNNKCVKILREYETRIRDVRDQERRDKELEIYSQELGIPLDWFAAKRKDKIAEVKRQHREDTKKKLKEIGDRMKQQSTARSGMTGLSTFTEEEEGDDDDEGDTASDSDISFTSGSSYSYSATDDDEAPPTDDESALHSGTEDAASTRRWDSRPGTAGSGYTASRGGASRKGSALYAADRDSAHTDDDESMADDGASGWRNQRDVMRTPHSTGSAK